MKNLIGESLRGDDLLDRPVSLKRAVDAALINRNPLSFDAINELFKDKKFAAMFFSQRVDHLIASGEFSFSGNLDDVS